jgi:hypothetical protein
MTIQIIFFLEELTFRRFLLAGKDYARDARSGVRNPVEARDLYVLQNVQNGSEACLPFYVEYRDPV